MSRVYIRFLSKIEEGKSVYPLIKFSVDSLPGNIFGIPEEALRILKEAGIGYSQVPHDEVVQALRKLRNFREGKIQTKKQRKLVLQSNSIDIHGSDK